MKLLKSVEGVGSVVAMNMIIATEAFTRFDNPRQFNCYVGVAPFAYTSGTSQHSPQQGVATGREIHKMPSSYGCRGDCP